MKKQPAKKYARTSGLHPILGTMASESRLRAQAWIRSGCNAFDGSDKKSTPLVFWKESDVLQYVAENNLVIASAYGEVIHDGDEYRTTGAERTGCLFCGFGAHLERKQMKDGLGRFQRLHREHPNLWDYCMRGGEWVDYIGYDPELPENEPDESGWIPWNPKKIWVPSSNGLGLRYVLDVFNEMYPKDVILYE